MEKLYPNALSERLGVLAEELIQISSKHSDWIKSIETDRREGKFTITINFFTQEF